MLQDKIQEVFNEPGCEHNKRKSEKDRKKGCTKVLKPGAAAGGCAFDGAKIALQPITDVVHLVHGPLPVRATLGTIAMRRLLDPIFIVPALPPTSLNLMLSTVAKKGFFAPFAKRLAAITRRLFSSIRPVYRL